MKQNKGFKGFLKRIFKGFLKRIFNVGYEDYDDILEQSFTPKQGKSSGGAKNGYSKRLKLMHKAQRLQNYYSKHPDKTPTPLAKEIMNAYGGMKRCLKW